MSQTLGVRAGVKPDSSGDPVASLLVRSFEKPRRPQTYSLAVMTQCLRFVKVNEHITDEFEEQERSSTASDGGDGQHDVHHELNAARKRLNDVATEFAACNALEI